MAAAPTFDVGPRDRLSRGAVSAALALSLVSCRDSARPSEAPVSAMPAPVAAAIAAPPPIVDAGSDAAVCAPAEVARRVARATRSVNACRSVRASVDGGGAVTVAPATIGAPEDATAVCALADAETSAMERAASAAIGDALACAGPGPIDAQGDDWTDLVQMRKALSARFCRELTRAGVRSAAVLRTRFVIEIDARGRVAAVKHEPGSARAPEGIACIERALEGLAFPCLAGAAVCQRWSAEEPPHELL